MMSRRDIFVSLEENAFSNRISQLTIYIPNGKFAIWEFAK